FFFHLSDPPVITKSNEGIVRAVNGQEVTLFCEASAVPPPTWTWLSSSGSELFTDETKYFINTSINQLSSSLRVVMSEIQDYGRYACKADNGVGETALQPIDVVQIPMLLSSSQTCAYQLLCAGQPPKPELMFENQHPNYASILIPNYAGLDAKEQPLLVVFEVVKESNFVENDFNWDSSDVVQTDMTFGQ
ncbi:immunoglobulin domain protein, partial [Trichinella nativa]